ncbi:DnaJ (Hsp40) homolog, subfamily C, member 4 [Nesidiocoris tenuis]|uniref:DnaJ (Hsp40) homolog, subfamily C, member 4 n=1 Tax=Nesidiocoris tenuis TaxID=355587 RepID=A0ABN7BB90_9HEMI|nr:DnaJ (Hsp40) homolog, subfamily C, member 4 [Nesidiocoris tenuis]
MFSWILCFSRLTTNSGRILKLDCRRWMSRSYYEILKVPQNCSSKEVRDAFISLSKQNHPDKHGNDPAMHERFVQINEAYSVLSNPTSRRSYDISLVSKRKLAEPHVRTSRPYQNQSYGQSSYSRASGSGGEEYYYTSWDKKTWEKAENARKGRGSADYYGLKGVKKVSNSTILLLVVGFMCVGGSLMWFIIQTYSKKIRDQMIERSHKLSLIHSMAQEKARLYGNEYQIAALKSTLLSTYDESELSDGTGQLHVLPAQDSLNPASEKT